MVRSRRPLWRYPLFQVPLMCLGACLVIATLVWVLELGRPKVSVAIAIDLSPSTYQSQTFNAPGTLMAEEFEAVRTYLRQNSHFLREPNQIQIFGFAGTVQLLTKSGFQTDNSQLEAQFNQAVQAQNLPQKLGSNATDINGAIAQATAALRSTSGCRELLLVISSATPVAASEISSALSQASKNQVKIDTAVVGGEAKELRNALEASSGLLLSGSLFSNKFLISFISNLKWNLFCLGAIWIALMWVLVLPFDRWVYQGMMKLSMSLAGRLALSNALFWTVLIPIIIWRLFSLPLFLQCAFV